jgi:hypothetical protein
METREVRDTDAALRNEVKLYTAREEVMERAYREGP